MTSEELEDRPSTAVTAEDVRAFHSALGDVWPLAACRDALVAAEGDESLAKHYIAQFASFSNLESPEQGHLFFENEGLRRQVEHLQTRLEDLERRVARLEAL